MLLDNAAMVGFVPTKDATKARAFYEGVLGFSVVSDNEWVMSLQSGEQRIMLQKNLKDEPLMRTIVGWEVRGIEDVVRNLTKAGVEFMRVQWVEQNELGIWHSPDGKVAWFKDPDGNTLSVSEH